ncbi:MAG: hypothetical protein Q4P65_03875 [Eubacteriales bacterium]|nr:hypothetical protein [Eubacteriales bacterium]
MKLLKKSLILSLILCLALLSWQPVFGMTAETSVNAEEKLDLKDELADKLKDVMQEIGLEGEDLGELSQDGIKKVQDLAKEGLKEAKESGIFDRLLGWLSQLLKFLGGLLKSLFKAIF